MIEDILSRHFHADELPVSHPVRMAIYELRRLRAERDALLDEQWSVLICQRPGGLALKVCGGLWQPIDPQAPYLEVTRAGVARWDAATQEKEAT